ncbi:MAG: hypothetical protein J6O49_05470, partial [Bacteroidaceae bacterium]|nr:hypothetical protein [Bacteroidaceae bacterium]
PVDEFDGVIDLSATQKKRFHVNRGRGDSGVLELNTSDFSIITRLENLYPKLAQLSHDATLKQLDMKETDSEKAVTKISQALTKIDMEMRQIVDDIFDAPVSEICAPSGTLFDPFNGEFRFEHILDVISKLYENNLNEEFKKMSDKMKKRTAKYTQKQDK